MSIAFTKELLLPQATAADIKLQDIENGRTNALPVSEPRIVTPSGESSRILFKESIGYHVRESIKEGTEIQYILISAGSTYNIERLTLKMCTLSAVECVRGKSKVVFKIDHIRKGKLIVFFDTPPIWSNIIGYIILNEKPCTAWNLFAKNSSETLNQGEKADLVEVIKKVGELYCASYPSASVTGLSDDSCPDVPKTPVKTRISNKTVAIFSSTLKSKICYAFVVGNFL